LEFLQGFAVVWWCGLARLEFLQGFAKETCMQVVVLRSIDRVWKGLEIEEHLELEQDR
jgi:hypothetical protein